MPRKFVWIMLRRLGRDGRRNARLTALDQPDARLTPLIVDFGDLFGGQIVFSDVTPGEHNESRERADQPDNDHPPDVPDQRKTSDDRKERRNKSSRAVARHFDRLVVRQVRKPPLFERFLLDAPISLFARHIGQHREIESRRRRSCNPFQASGHPMDRP